MFEDIPTTAPRRYGFLNLFQQLVFLRVVIRNSTKLEEKKSISHKNKNKYQNSYDDNFQYDDRGLLMSSNRLKK